MSDPTKSCNLTEEEIRHLIAYIGNTLYTHDEPDTKIERINYLNKRLKAFKEPITADTDALNPDNQQIKSTATAVGWGNNG